MKTSERLDQIAEGLRMQRADLLRLAVDLPSGRTLDLVEATVTALWLRMKALQEEAAQLRRYLD